jgi:hypothetical protein
MDNKNDIEQIKLAQKEAVERMKKEVELYKAERKAALTWNIIFFIGILMTSISISLLTKSESFNLKEFFSTEKKDSISLISAFAGLTLSFLIGVLGSYFKSKINKDKNSIEIKEFIKESFINRIEKSNLNPQR